MFNTIGVDGRLDTCSIHLVPLTQYSDLFDLDACNGTVQYALVRVLPHTGATPPKHHASHLALAHHYRYQNTSAVSAQIFC